MRPTKLLLSLVALLLACSPADRRIYKMSSEWRAVLVAYHRYAHSGCASTRQVLETCAACSRRGTPQRVHAELLTAFCTERDGSRDAAESAYLALAASYPGTSVALTAQLRIRHLDLPRYTKVSEVPPHADAKALVREPPTYPQLAAIAQIKGWVLLMYDVTEKGRVEGVQVLDSEPPYLFEESAVNAALEFRYEPRKVKGVQIVLSFDGLEKPGT